MDPLAEKYYDVSPYAYCHNNPVNLFDPDGMDDYFDFAGKFMKHTDSGNDILMQTRNGGFINITQVDYSNQTDALLNIGTYYLSQVDKNFKLTIGHTGGENPLDAALTNFSGTENYELLIDDNGRINQEYGNSSNFINSFYP